MNELVICKTGLPAGWSYEDSVKKVSGLVYKWKNMTLELANELRVARENLSSQGGRSDLTSEHLRRSWGGYCKDIGIEKSTANRWLKQFFPSEEKAIEHNADENMCAVSDLNELIERGRKFKTLLADPPWAYSNQATRAATNNHYDTMTVDEICALPVSELTDENAHLHLWTTNAFLFDAKKVMEAWGFQYKSCFLWIKPTMGIGNYWRVSHEFMLLGIKGSLTFQDHAEISWYQEKRSNHSRKPIEIIKKIEKVSPGPYLELFGRETRDNWVVWGNEIARTLFNEEAFG